MLTRAQKYEIKQHYRHWKLRFIGLTVYAQKRPGGAYGVLYTPSDTVNHLKTVNLL